jgi:hypothetical protein
VEQRTLFSASLSQWRDGAKNSGVGRWCRAKSTKYLAELWSPSKDPVSSHLPRGVGPAKGMVRRMEGW